MDDDDDESAVREKRNKCRPVGLRNHTMFSTRLLFRDVPCPLRDSCNRPICLCSHNPAAVLTVTQVDPVHVPLTTPTTIVPAKRRAQADAPLDLQQAPSSSRQSCPVDAERPTKLQKAGSAAKPVAVPTASSSSVSSVQSFTSSWLLNVPLWHPRPVFRSSRSMLGSQRYPFRHARYVTDLVSVGSQRGLWHLPPPIRVPSALCVAFVSPLHAHILASSSTHSYQGHVEIIIRSFCRPLQLCSSSKSLISI